MIEDLAADGIVLRRRMIAEGYDDAAILRARRRGHIVRIRQGAYAIRSSWDQSSSFERRLMVMMAVRRQYDDTVALSHASACAVHGGPTWGLDLSDVHLTHLATHGERKAAGIVHHRGQCRVGDLTRDADGWITTPVRTALDTASTAPRVSAVAVLDWFLHEGLVTSQSLLDGFEAMRAWPDTLALRRSLQLADGRSESVGETRARLLCRDEGLPLPIPQFEVRAPGGRFVGRVDLAWPGLRTMLEFDGRVKYVNYLRPGETIQTAVLREKRREDELREVTGWTMVRLSWADLDQPRSVAARLRRAFSAAA